MTGKHMIELKGEQAMWYMIDYENVHEEGLYGIEMLKKDDRIFVFYNMGDKENVENGKLREAACLLYTSGSSAIWKQRGAGGYSERLLCLKFAS